MPGDRQGCARRLPGGAQPPGTHGISLIAHAQAGGNEVVPVCEYLQSLSSQSTKDRVV